MYVTLVILLLIGFNMTALLASVLVVMCVGVLTGRLKTHITSVERSCSRACKRYAPHANIFICLHLHQDALAFHGFPPDTSLFLRMKRATHSSYKGINVQQGQSVVLTDGAKIHIKFLYVLRVMGINTIWLHGNLWQDSSAVVDYWDMNTLQLTNSQRNAPLKSVSSIFLTAHIRLKWDGGV